MREKIENITKETHLMILPQFINSSDLVVIVLFLRVSTAR